MRNCSCIAVLLLAASVNATDETQTDWSGGPEPGPVALWEDHFEETTGINWYDTPGEITLGVPEFIVDPSLSGAECVDAADIDDDGYLDIVACAMSGNDIIWYENVDGSGSTWTEHVIDGSVSSPICVYAADVDDDGDLDVLNAAYYSGIYWYENTNGAGTSWTKRTIDANFHNGAWSVYAVDIDGDNDLDAIGTAISLNTVAWFENTNGTGTSWTTHNIDTAFSGTRSSYAEDINGDSFVDVIAAATSASDVAWYQNNGSGTSWVKRNVDTNFPGAAYVRAGDINGDSDMDILAGGFTAGVSWWENMNGSGTSWTERVVDSGLSGAVCVKAEDVDKDGDQDILAASLNDDQVVWWENTNGSGTSWTEHLVCGSFDGAYSIAPGDFDDDSNWDATSCAYYGNEVRWWGLSGYAAVAELTSNILGLSIVDQIVDWGQISWTCTEPGGTDVAFLIRASDDFGNMGPWSDTITVSGTDLDPILDSYDFFVQYKVIFTTSSSIVTPTLEDITVSWTPWVGVEEGESAGMTLTFLPCSPNPATGYTTAGLYMPEQGPVIISIFDLSGRLISVPVNGTMPEGDHAFVITAPSAGVYLCRIEAGGLTSVERFVIIGD
jgi:hypothetical protein